MGRSRVPAAIRAMIAKQHPPAAPTLRQRPAHWPVGVDSALEMALVTRLERHGLPLGEGQHRFVPGRLYRFDRAWPDQRVDVVRPHKLLDPKWGEQLSAYSNSATFLAYRHGDQRHIRRRRPAALEVAS